MGILKKRKNIRENKNLQEDKYLNSIFDTMAVVNVSDIVGIRSNELYDLLERKNK